MFKKLLASIKSMILKLIYLLWGTLKFAWGTLKKMKTWRGILSLIIVWLIFSGSGLIVIGMIFKMKHLVIWGGSIYSFWILVPFTPLTPLVIIVAMFLQMLLGDKAVSFDIIKEEFNKAFKNNKESNKMEKEKVNYIIPFGVRVELVKGEYKGKEAVIVGYSTYSERYSLAIYSPVPTGGYVTKVPSNTFGNWEFVVIGGTKDEY